MAEEAGLEHSTLKVPYEVLNKSFRSAQKTLDKEISCVQNAAPELSQSLATENVGDVSTLVDGIIEKLKVLKAKSEADSAREMQASAVLKSRLEHVQQYVDPGAPGTSQMAPKEWRKMRVNRWLVEHLLHEGCYETAEKLSEKTNLGDLTNVELYKITRDVEQDLAQHSVTKCLAWCAENRSPLKRMQSSLEFNLHVQVYVEMVKLDKRLEALAYARDNLPTYDKYNHSEMGHVMALLAFPVDTHVQPYQTLYNVRRWDKLLLQFKYEHYRVYRVGTEPMFTVALETGISVLKTPDCFSSGNKNDLCPVCQDSYNQIAAELPYALCTQSRLVCRITGELLDENNRPLILPNGQVYGQKGISQLAEPGNGYFVCPTTQEVFNVDQAEKVFIM